MSRSQRIEVWLLCVLGFFALDFLYTGHIPNLIGLFV